MAKALRTGAPSVATASVMILTCLITIKLKIKYSRANATNPTLNTKDKPFEIKKDKSKIFVNIRFPLQRIVYELLLNLESYQLQNQDLRHWKIQYSVHWQQFELKHLRS